LIKIERLTIFRGSTALPYASAQIVKSDDHIVNAAKMTIEADVSVTSASVIDFKKADESTVVFTAKVQKISEIDIWSVDLLSNGFELHNVRVEKVYTNVSPEAIVEDVVDNFTANLTYVSSVASGIIINKYIAKAYAIDVIKDMMDALKWSLRIDENDNVYFEPAGTVDNGAVFTNGSNVQITSWIEDKKELFNHVKIVGGFENFSTDQTFAATDTVFVLDHKPAAIMKVVVSGSEISPDDYTVDAENKTVTFDSSQENPTFSYSYDRPVIVEDQDDISISTYGEVFKEIPAPWMNTFADARQYSQQLLDAFSTPIQRIKVTEPGLNWDIEVGESVLVSDPIRDKSSTVAISKITYKAGQNVTQYELNTRDPELFDWQREVMDRIKKMERRFVNEDVVVFARTFKHKLQAQLTESLAKEFNSPTNTFILDHETLSRLKDPTKTPNPENFEADCSDNNNDGVWSGTGVDGSQFEFISFPLSSHYLFNGNSLDSTSNSNDGTDTAITYVAGKINQAASFNATTSVIQVADSSTIQDFYDGGGTTSVWVFLNSDGGGNSGRVYNKNADNTILAIFGESGSKAKIYFRQRFSPTDGEWQSGLVVNVGEWNHLLFVYNSDSDNNVPSAYVNGVSVAMSQITKPDGTRTSDAGTDLYIGNNAGGDRGFDGEIDDLRVYKGVPVSLRQIDSIYNSGSGTENNLSIPNVPRLYYGTFNGSDRKITVDDAASLRFTGDLSIHLSINVSSLPGATTPLIDKHDGTDGYKVFINASNQVSVTYSDSGSDSTLAASTALVADKWQNFIFTKSGTDMTIYIDGTSDNTGTGDATIGSNTDDLTIGTDGLNYLNGLLDEIRLYNRAMTQIEVTDLNKKFSIVDGMTCYLSMDNPKLDIRQTARQAVT